MTQKVAIQWREDGDYAITLRHALRDDGSVIADVPDDTLARWLRVICEYQDIQDEIHLVYQDHGGA